VAILAAGVVGMRIAKERGSLTVLKKPLPIRKPLRDLDRTALAPYEVLSTRRLAADIVEELGTKEYIDWVLKDTRPQYASRKNVYLSVTYYTDVVDQISHVPEECYFQGAFSQAGDETLNMRLDRQGEAIPVRRLAFFPPHEFVKKTYVYYTFSVNGTFHTNRQAVRLHLADPRDTHLYYSKVEIRFRDVADKYVSIVDERARELFDLVITELVRSHWPRKGAERAALLTEPGRSLERQRFTGHDLVCRDGALSGLRGERSADRLERALGTAPAFRRRRSQRELG